MVDYLFDGPKTAKVTLLLAHGAGAAMDSAWMNQFASGVAAEGLRVARFEFAYMAARRQGERKPPPRGESLMGEYRDAIAALGAKTPLVIGGKSLGGRVASMVAEAEGAAGRVAGLVCLGYPFHPPGQTDKLRVAHLEKLKLKTLICQGTRDPFGTREEVAAYTLGKGIKIHWLEDGDHDFRARVKISGRTPKQNLDEAVAAVVAFASKLAG
jgi:predicted alpha/beta-hydrolase family hydrolase